MATVQPVYTKTNMAGVRVVSWTLANGDVGAPIAMPRHGDKTVDIGGTFGAAGSITLRGNNATSTPDPTDVSATGAWAALTDAQGNAITKTAKSVEVIEENTYWYSPYCSAGDGTTAIKVTIVGRKA